MDTTIVIREYAVLQRGEQIANPNLNQADIPASAFAWLERKAEDPNWKGILKFKNANTLQVKQYVGYIQTSCGLGIEILPKNTLDQPQQSEDHCNQARTILWNLLQKGLKLSVKHTDIAHLNIRKQPVHEWIFAQFLQELKTLVLRGIRNDYLQVEEESRFIRGQLDIDRQIRNQATCRKTHFHIRHDVYQPNRLENRLLATALRLIARCSRDPQNLQWAHELNVYFADIPNEPITAQVWERWDGSRLMQHYATIKLWCQLILNSHNPEYLQGRSQGMALLFDMNMLFEKYVTHCLEDLYQVKSQPSSQYLLESERQQKLFKLKPDLILNQNMVGDCKWKLLDITHPLDSDKTHFSISHSDLYQLVVHGLHYLPQQQGKLVLFYPDHAGFKQPVYFKLPYNPHVQLAVIPFPLNWDEASKTTIQQWVEKILI